MTLRSVNPANGRVLREYAEHSPGEVERRLNAAVEAFEGWRRSRLEERADVLREAARVLERDLDTHAYLIVEEMGKPLAQAEQEVHKCVKGLRYAAEKGPAVLAPRPLEEGVCVIPEPLGPLLGIMPWNFPYWQAVRFTAPALLAGNVILLKHASNVTGCLLALEEVFSAAASEPLFQALALPSARVGAVIRDERIRGVSLTGSETAGRKVGAEAAGALKPVVLELGGSDPFIVLADAPLEAAAKAAARGRCVNSGESCIAAKRFFVHESLYNDFVEAFAHEMATKRVGDPLQEETEVGPLAREDLREAVERQVEASVEAGAHVVTGGRRLAGPGYYYEPTVLVDVRLDMPVMAEEVFGPVAPVMPFQDEAQAVALANATRYGLGAAIWTTDLDRGRRVARRLAAGMVFVNDIVASDPSRPFGGVKASGFGRELGEEGFRAFVNLKTEVVRPPPGPRSARGRGERLPAVE
ncbi:MAG TPA: NAD-dependent succinate-semialdehyde dehydrogenase [Candidatus Thermoplasmatota archaeon]|nr:NAD-dependent succinate-semialdehyde dehydrogenase [Candidatus Thermoplasmatota archaeon]